jgi:hypothetical protein
MSDALQDIEKLEADLWEAADNLRANSKLTSSDYFMPVLGVIFLRHAANRFETATCQIEADQAADRMPKHPLLPADYLRRRALWLPAAARYDWIMQQAATSGSDLPTLITEAMTAELADAEKPYETDCARLLADLDSFRTQYTMATALPLGEEPGLWETNQGLHAARRKFDPIAEALRGLIKQVDLLYKFAARVADLGSELAVAESVADGAEVNRESLGSSFDGEIEYVDISSVTPGQINETAVYDFHDAPSRARRVVRHGDIIWSCVRPNRRSHAVIWQPSSNLIVSTGFAVLTPRTVPTAFLYFATTTDAFVGYLENHARGAAYPAVVSGDFERAKLLIPSRALLMSLTDFVEPTLSQIHYLRVQNQKLRAARDLLLPRLMNGEIAV